MKATRIVIVLGLFTLTTACIGVAVRGGKAAYEQMNRRKLEPLAQKGDVEAQFRLGKSYCCGYGAAYDTEKALQWFCKAARQGHAEAQHEVGRIYGGKHWVKARDVPTEKVPALMWYDLSVAGGHEDAKGDRDDMIQELTADQIAEALRLCTNWKTARCEL